MEAHKDDELSDPVKESEIVINKINEGSSNIYVKIKIGNQTKLAMIDTGSIKSCMSLKQYQSLHEVPSLTDSQLRFRTATGSPITVHGSVQIDIFIEDSKYTRNFSICDINESIILGTDLLNDVIIDFPSLLLRGQGLSAPLYRTSNSNLIVNLINNTISEEGAITCQLDNHNLQLPGTFIYTPNPSTWGPGVSPVIVNIKEETFEIVIQNFNNQLYLPKGSVIGTLSEVRINSIQEELETWNMSPDQRIELIVEQVKLYENEILTDQEKAQVRELLLKYHDVFSLSKYEMSVCSIYTHEIHLKTDDIVQHPHRPIPIHQVETVQKLVKELVKCGVMERCESQYRSPLMLIDKRSDTSSKKKDKRLVVDYRLLNSISQDILYPMPDLESTRALCGSANLYTVFDSKNAFWQIKLKKSSRDCTSTWVTGLGCFRFKVCPQGAKSSPKALQAVTDIMFADMKG